MHGDIQGIIFDLDGTLADTLADLTDAVNVALKACGYPARPASDIRAWVGDGMPALCRRAMAGNDEAAAQLSDERVAQMAAAMRAHYREHRLDATRPYPGIPALLDALAGHRIAMAILSNKPQDHTEAIVQALFGAYPWAAVEGCREDSLRKPDPQAVWPVIARMRLRPRQVMMVGDSAVDVLTGRNAGTATVGVTWGFRQRDELIAAGVEYLIDRPEQLLQLV